MLALVLSLWLQARKFWSILYWNRGKGLFTCKSDFALGLKVYNTKQYILIVFWSKSFGHTEPGNPYRRGKLITIELLELISLDHRDRTRASTLCFFYFYFFPYLNM